MGDDNTVRTNIEIALTRDDSAKAKESLDQFQTRLAGTDNEIKSTLDKARGSVGGVTEEMAEKTKLPQRELRILAGQLGRDIPGAAELMRAGFVGGEEPMLAGIFALIAAVEIAKESIKALYEATLEGIKNADDYKQFNEELAQSFKNNLAEAINAVEIRIAHLNDSYDQLGRNIQVANEAADNHAKILNATITATESLEQAQIKLRQAMSFASGPEAHRETTEAKIRADIRKQEIEDSKNQITHNNLINESITAGIEGRKELAKVSPGGDLFEKQVHAKNLLDDAQKQADSRKTQYDAKIKEAEDYEAKAITTLKVSSTLGPVAAGAGRSLASHFMSEADESRKQAGVLSPAAEQQKAEKAKLAKDKIDADVKYHTDLAEKRLAEERDSRQKADDLASKMTATRQANAVTNTAAEQTANVEDISESIQRADQLVQQKPGQKRNEAIKLLVAHVHTLHSMDAEQQKDIDTILEELKNMRLRHDATGI